MAVNKELKPKDEAKPAKSPAALKEEEILKFWQENGIFEKSLKKNEGKKEFVFYEGPPTANGKPGIHHLEARAFKDAIPRYKTMRGFYVRRKGGWDTHGLPVELQVEKELGLKSKKEIETYGIAAFNQMCKQSVWTNVDVWKTFTERMGYWVDLEHAYVTYEPEYMESLWAILKRIHERELLYKDYKVVPWCPRCGTGLSSHELAQGYEDVKDLSLTAKFHLKPGQKWGKGYETQDTAYILAWTTTPWTLPGNVGLAVGPEIFYTALREEGIPALYILASDRVSSVCKDKKIEIVHDSIKGSELVGLEYEPLYPFLKDSISGKEKEKLGNAFKVYAADFVTTTDGTGVVHTAVMYGSDDFELGTKVGLPKHHLVHEDGTFKKEAGPLFAGRFVKEKDEKGKPTLDVDIIDDLKKKGLFFSQETYKHSYPHCWRCKTPLIYYARDSWYIRMSLLRSELLKENEGINWEPSHIKNGRFGEWLKDVKDWAISRERYWGTPLPIWKCRSCTKTHVIGSIEDLKEKTASNNSYFVMRHGEAESNVLDIISSDPNLYGLTEKGKAQAKESAKKLKDRGIDLIITSPFKRTKSTAKIVKETLGLPDSALVVESLIHEINAGVLNGKSRKTYRSYALDTHRFSQAPADGESQLEVKRRMGDFIYGLEKRYKGKKILVITHDSPAWLLFAAAESATVKRTYELHDNTNFFLKNAEVRELPFHPLPHNTDYEIDLHRPYIDEVTFACECGGKMERVKEVVDVWFDSGSMPFAQNHYPFENKKYVETTGYPADFISEAIDQTRGWFYTLHAVGILMGKGKAYKNVICLGHILDKEGKKMSKSLGNIVDPWKQIEMFGVDALRFFMYSVNQPGDSKNYDEKTVDEIVKKVFNPLQNILSFYEIYAGEIEHEDIDPLQSENVLDQWILAKTEGLVKLVTESLDAYKLFEPARALRDYIGDFSQWYLRRSRERFKGDDMKDKAYALAVTSFVLSEIAKLMAPLTPFFAESLYQKVKGGVGKESVHLEDWPVQKFKVESLKFSIRGMFSKKPETKRRGDIIETMEEVRRIVSLGLEARAKANIKVRQPLKKLKVKSEKLKAGEGENQMIGLIRDEVNVKEVEIDNSIAAEVELDTLITPDLEEEGDVRELMRAIQDMRKKKELTVNDNVVLHLEANDAGQKLIEKNKAEIVKTTNLKDIQFGKVEGEEIKIKEYTFKIKM